MSWHLNIWKVKVWLSQEQKDLSKWNKKTFFFVSQILFLDLKIKLAKIEQTQPLKVKLSNSQPNEFKSGIKNGTEVTSNYSSNVISDFNYGTSFPHRLLSTDTQVSRLFKTFANGSSANR